MTQRVFVLKDDKGGKHGRTVHWILEDGIHNVKILHNTISVDSFSNKDPNECSKKVKEHLDRIGRIISTNLIKKDEVTDMYLKFERSDQKKSQKDEKKTNEDPKGDASPGKVV